MRKLLVFAMLAALALPPGANAALLPQDDAGSGTDAPDTPTPSFRIDPGVVYSGAIEGKTGGDSADWYAFTAPAGATLEARASGVIGCVTLYDAAGAKVSGAGCSGGYAELWVARGVAGDAGTYYVQYAHDNAAGDTAAQTYRFSVGVGAPAPAPTLPVSLDDLSPPAPRGVAPVAPASQAGEHVVIAVVDTGVNPYHDFFAAPALTDHPGGWLAGFPSAAETVGLSLDEPSYTAARAADDATWDGLSRSTYDPATDTYDTHLYTFPGTRVVGAVSFGELTDVTDPLGPVPATPVLDENGHGTHSAGLALGAHLAEADGNVLLVMVEIGQGTFEEGIRWAARQPWIDAISVSLGNRANVPTSFSAIGDRSSAEWATLEAHQAGQPVFVASGNGVSNLGIPPDKCSTYTSEYTGPAWITRVGAAHERGGNPTWWHCVPVEVIARTDVDSPVYDDLAAISPAGGTSASTPNVAGHFAHLLLAGRRNGSTASRFEVRDHLLHSAAPAETVVYLNDPSVYPLSLADQGYGLVDQAALDDATTRVLAGTGPEPRPETAAWFEKDAEIRTALWGPGSVTEGSDPGALPGIPEAPQDDAGSGGDAPDEPGDDIAIEPGVRYSGTLTGYGTDDADWYAFEGTAGDVVNATASAAIACYDLVSPSGVLVHTGCSTGGVDLHPVGVTLTESGTWHLGISYFVPQTYSFGFGLNAPPPVVFP